MAVEQDLLTLASQHSTNLTFDYPMDQRDVTFRSLSDHYASTIACVSRGCILLLKRLELFIMLSVSIGY